MTGRKILIFRLSSLGDVVLASTVLSTGMLEGVVDWVVAAEFAPLLKGHPGVRKVWEFDRKKGLRGWLGLCDELAAEGYDEVYDLHSSLRTRLARFWFLARGSRGGWKRLPKVRWRLYGLYALRSAWPAKWRPIPFVRRFGQFVGGAGNDRPDLTFMTSEPLDDGLLDTWLSQESKRGASAYYCVMPGSKWAGKCWAPAKYLEVIRALSRRNWVPVVLGSSDDPGSEELVKLLRSESLSHFSGVARWNLRQVAGVLAKSKAYLGSDTGLAHLAESLGVPALIIFGPTSPEIGFGPWRPSSRAIGVQGLGCRPCGKDGRRCYRPTRKYLCMTALEASEVIKSAEHLRKAEPLGEGGP